MICFRKSRRLLSGETPIKVTSDAKSSRLFWIGVPDKHQRRFADILDTARNSFVDIRRIIWAAVKNMSVSFLQNHATYKQQELASDYLRQGQFETI